MSTTHDDARRYYALCDRARALGIDTDLRGDESRTVAQLEAEVRAALVSAVVDGIGAQLGRDGLLALHGELVTLPVTVGTADGIVSELLTALERAYMANGEHSVKVLRCSTCAA